MAQAQRHVPGCEDLQVEVMQAVDHALNDAATRLCLRHGHVTGIEARWFLAEAAIVSLFASILKCNEDLPIFQLAELMARQAIDHLAKGSAVPLDQAAQGGGVKG